MNITVNSSLIPDKYNYITFLYKVYNICYLLQDSGQQQTNPVFYM